MVAYSPAEPYPKDGEDRSSYLERHEEWEKNCKVSDENCMSLVIGVLINRGGIPIVSGGDMNMSIGSKKSR